MAFWDFLDRIGDMIEDFTGRTRSPRELRISIAELEKEISNLEDELVGLQQAREKNAETREKRRRRGERAGVGLSVKRAGSLGMAYSRVKEKLEIKKEALKDLKKLLRRAERAS